MNAEHEDISLDKKDYSVFYTEAIDPKNCGVKCPKCKRKKSAFGILIEIKKVLFGDDEKEIELTAEIKLKMERAVRRKLVVDGSLVTQKLSCEDCCDGENE